ncbi:hypothetical protein C922_03744 [Plasmodium inui San Antonio 1]|uniref:PIPK domain-containing protein n=1 Tax=Plasmodium inui San Antonio 1 TaxID=1237626 RepID=W7AKA9_9APIC|nr:hypothetical protein C922_03744 [Plasmodium inui San Antonio 1]EUD65761.1 hypothetical protein C922_03744 [Plasmodium inui San Antonio 1]
MEESLSDRYFSFRSSSKQRNTSQRFFELILNYPLFNEIRNRNLSNRFSSLCVNDGEQFYPKQTQVEVKRRRSKKKDSSVPISEPNELTTNLIKNGIRQEDYSLIVNNKFYSKIIKRSEKIYKTYNDDIKDERRKKYIFEKVKEKYFKKIENSRMYIPPVIRVNYSARKKKKKILDEEFNPFFTFFERDINKNVYHDSINFSLKTNIHLNRYFYKVITNQLRYYRIKKDLHVHVRNILNEISKYYHSYGYDILTNVKVKYFPYNSPSNSFYINGLVFSNCSIYFDDVEIKNPKILLLDAEKRNNYEVLEQCYNNKYNYTYFILKKLSNRNLNIILIHGEIDVYTKKLLMSKKIYFFTSIKKKNLCRLSNMLRTKVLSYDDFVNFDNNSYVVKANYFKIERYRKNVKNIFLCCSGNFLTICIFGRKEIRDGNEPQVGYTPANSKFTVIGVTFSNLDNPTERSAPKNRIKSRGEDLFYTLLNKETKKQNILENFLQVYYKNKSDDYIVDYFFQHKEKKIGLVETESRGNKKKALIDHIKNVIIIKKVKKLLKFCLFLTFHVYKQLYLNNYMGRMLQSVPAGSIHTNAICDNFYKKLSQSILSSSIFFFYNDTKRKIKKTPINFMSNLFHLVNVNNPLTRERMKILHMLIKTNKIIKDQICNNFEHCFLNAGKNKIIDVVNYFFFNNFMKNWEINYNYMYYYLKIINSSYLYCNWKNLIPNEENFLNDSNLLPHPVFFNDEIVMERKVNEKAEEVIAQNILFYCYHLEAAKNIEMITYFICPNYMFINNLYNCVNMYLFDSQNHSVKKLFYNFFFNHKYICDVSLRQFVCVIHDLAYTLNCPFDACGKQLGHHQICIQIFLKRVLILFKKESSDREEDEVSMNIICNKCDMLQERVLKTNFSLSEFLLSIVHSDSYVNVQCNHNGKNNTYELSYKDLKVYFLLHDNDIYKSIKMHRTGEEKDGERASKRAAIKAGKGVHSPSRSSEGRSPGCCSHGRGHNNCEGISNTERRVKRYIKKNMKNVIRSSVFYYYPCKCVARKNKCRFETGKKKTKRQVYTSFNLYNVIENFPFFTSSMLPMYCSLKYLIYNCAIQYYRSKNRHLYGKPCSKKKKKKEKFKNPASPLYFTNRCKKCKHIKIANFCALGFFNVLFIIKRIFFNFYIAVNFLIGLITKNMLIKVNEIVYCVNNTEYFIEDNFLIIKGEMESRREDEQGGVQWGEKSEKRQGEPLDEHKIEEPSSNRDGDNEVLIKQKYDLFNSVMTQLMCGGDMESTQEGGADGLAHTMHSSPDPKGDVTYMTKKDETLNRKEVHSRDANRIVNCDSKQTSKNHAYILKDINRIKEDLIKQFLIFRKFKNKMDQKKEELTRVFRRFYTYAIVHLMEKEFSLGIEMFFSLYIRRLEKINLRIEGDIERMTKLANNRKLQYLSYVARGAWGGVRVRRQVKKSPKETIEDTKLDAENSEQTCSMKPMSSPPTTYRSAKRSPQRGLGRVQLMRRWRRSKKKYALLNDMNNRKRRKKGEASNLENPQNRNEDKSELSNYFYFVREYDVQKLYTLESYYIYNIENYRKREYLDDMNKEEYEHSNKKLFYLHISKIVHSVRSDKSSGKKTGGTEKEQKTSAVFLLNPSDTSNSIFHALISDEYKLKLAEIYDKEREALRADKKQHTLEEQIDEAKNEIALVRKEFKPNGSKERVIQKRPFCGKKKSQRGKHSAVTQHEEIKKYLKKNIRRMANRNLTNGMINQFLNCKNDEVVVIPINENISVYIYFPLQFYYLRKFLCKRETTFLRSLIKSNCINFDHKKRHFVKTYDDKYIIKEINKYEFKSFITRYKEFFQHFSDIFFQGKKSLLCFMFGLYQIEIKKRSRKTVKAYIILENVKIENRNSKILIFDIKGARKKKNLQKLMKQNKKSSSFFERDDAFSYNSFKTTEERDMLDDNSSGISENLGHFTRYIRREKKINFKGAAVSPSRGVERTNGRMIKLENGRTNKRTNTFYNKTRYLDFLSAEKAHTSKGARKGENNSKQDGADEMEGLQNGMEVSVPNAEGERMHNLITRGGKEGAGNKKRRTPNGLSSQNNEERVRKVSTKVRQKMLCGLLRQRLVERGRKLHMKSRLNKNSSQIRVEKTRDHKNWRIFTNDIVHHTRMFLSLNSKMTKLRKRKNRRRGKGTKRIRTKYFCSTKASLHFLARKKNCILNRANLSKHKLRGEVVCAPQGSTPSREGTYSFLDKEVSDSKNMESLNSMEKYNNFAIENYNCLKNYTVLFDDNFKDFIKWKVINLEYCDYKDLMDSLREDTDFLSGQDIMDYSLLIHIDVANFVIIFKIIDYLRPYTWDKSVENFSKSVLYLTKGYRPTIIHSEYYKKRFLSNIKKYIFYYLPIYALKRKIVFKIAERKGSFSVFTLSRRHPFKVYFFHQLFNLIIRYYNNYYIYMKYFNVHQAFLRKYSFVNIFSSQNLLTFLSYYQKECYLQSLKEKKRDDAQLCEHFYVQSVLYEDDFSTPDSFSNPLKSEIVLRNGNLNREIMSRYFDTNKVNSNSSYLYREASTTKMREDDAHVYSLVFPYCTLDDRGHPQNGCAATWRDVEGHQTGDTKCDTRCDDHGGGIPLVREENNPLRTNNHAKANGEQTNGQTDHPSDGMANMPNFFSHSDSFDEREYEKLKKQFYKKISNFQIKILKKLQKNNFKIEGISQLVQNNVYIHMTDTKMHYTNMNYLDVFNIYNICEKGFRLGSKRSKCRKKEHTLLYVPSYFLFALNKN